MNFGAHSQEELHTKERSEVSDKYKWDLTDLYPSDESWTEAKKKVLKQIDKIPSFKGTLAESSSKMLACFKFMDEIRKEMRRLSSYSWNKFNQDTRDSKYQAMKQETNHLFTKFNTNAAFMEPEIAAIDESTIQKFIRNEPGLKPYSFYLNDLFRRKKHTLSESKEKLIAETGPMARTPSSIYSIFMNTEFTGKVYEYKGTLGALMYGKINVDVYNSRVRGYKDCLEMTLYPDNIPVAVYHNLISNAKKNLDKFHRYLNIRKRLLGIDTLKYSDLSNPMVTGIEPKYNVGEAKELILESLKPLGKGYSSIVQKAFENRWIDMYPTPGKRSGSYNDFGAYNEHPYILMNFNGGYRDVSILTHELGHALHRYFSDKNQPFPTANYSTFLAEVAALFNEELLKKKVLGMEKIEDDDRRLYFLLANIESSIFNRAQVSEFELKIHQEVEKGNPLTGDIISRIYLETLRKYYGHDQGVCIIPDTVGMNWAFDRLLFVRTYAIYRYATSQIAAIALAENVFNKKKGALKKYLGFLSSGGSDYPIQILKEAGVDLTSPEPFQKTMDSMVLAMDEIDRILEKKGR
jgi:oligoendopeptidase F